MRNDPKSISQKDNTRISSASRTFTTTLQYGRLSSPLLSLPSESLTHITSFLDPLSLHSLSLTCQKFYEHVSDDNTWHRAFVCQIFGVAPESALTDCRPLTFRSTGKTWKGEFVRRDIVRRLWSRSINTPILHNPLHARISAIHAMPDSALLSASIQDGLVARSFPFTGKVLKGYLNATGVPPGLSFDDPGTELAPNISVCVLASDGTSAKVIWGRRDGSVSIVTHPRTMSGSKGSVGLHTSLVDQEHEDAVLDGTWAVNGDAFVTAGADGRVKFWTTRPFRCAWTSERHLQGLQTDAIVKVVEDLDDGFVVAASRSGDIIILSGFDMSLNPVDTPQPTIHKFSISAQELSKADSVDILSLSVLVCRVDSTHFYRCAVDLPSKQVTAKVFGNPAFGLIRCIHPAFSNEPAEPDFVVAGTQLGFISIYDWNESRHADVFDNSHVTAWLPTPSDVGQIVLIDEALVASVGGKVIAWSSGHLTPGSKDALKTKVKVKQRSRGKGPVTMELEIRNEVAEAKNRLAEESRSFRRTFGPEHEQSKKLQALGLSEREAVEYALMLSRDEELQRFQRNTEHVDEQETDESSGRQSGSESSFPLSSSSSDRNSPPALSRSPASETGSSSSRLLMPLAPPTSNVKVQVSSRVHPEPRKAGGLPDSPSDSQPPR
ncbi:hypothetical protein EI94DRAFT_1733990, partial [Lactarius quietus]